MIILTVRTDKPEAEIGIYKGVEKAAYTTWKAHRQLAETLHEKIDQMLADTGLNRSDLEGIVGFEGPGSFTGLRIGLSVCNALAYSLDLPAVGADGDQWQQKGISRLLNGENDTAVMPKYGGNANITLPRK